MHVIYWYLLWFSFYCDHCEYLFSLFFSYHCDHCDLPPPTDIRNITDIDISNLAREWQWHKYNTITHRINEWHRHTYNPVTIIIIHHGYLLPNKTHHHEHLYEGRRMLLSVSMALKLRSSYIRKVSGLKKNGFKKYLEGQKGGWRVIRMLCLSKEWRCILMVINGTMKFKFVLIMKYSNIQYSLLLSFQSSEFRVYSLLYYVFQIWILLEYRIYSCTWCNHVITASKRNVDIRAGSLPKKNQCM